MEPNGPLYHRNGARLYPKPLPIVVIGCAITVALAELALGISSIIH